SLQVGHAAETRHLRFNARFFAVANRRDVGATNERMAAVARIDSGIARAHVHRARYHPRRRRSRSLRRRRIESRAHDVELQRLDRSESESLSERLRRARSLRALFRYACDVR